MLQREHLVFIIHNRKLINKITILKIKCKNNCESEILITKNENIISYKYLRLIFTIDVLLCKSARISEKKNH